MLENEDGTLSSKRWRVQSKIDICSINEDMPGSINSVS